MADDPEPERHAASPAAPARVRRVRWKAIVVTVVVAAAAATIAYLRFIRPVPVRTHTVERGDVAVLVHGRGTIESRREAQLGFDLVGRISDVLVDEGDRVELGQPLAQRPRSGNPLAR